MKKYHSIILIVVIIVIAIASWFLLMPRELNVLIIGNYDKQTNSYTEFIYSYIEEYDKGKYGIVFVDDKNNSETKYEYTGFPNDKGITTDKDNTVVKVLNESYLVISYKTKGISSSYLKDHIEDQLVRLNDDKTSEVLYTSLQDSRIIYSNGERVLVFNASDCSYELFDYSENKTVKTVESKVGKMFDEYDFIINLDDGTLEVSGTRVPIRNIKIESFNLEEIMK